MDKKEAIRIVEDYINQKEFNWEMIYILDDSPVETSKLWVFKNLWEARESIRGNRVFINSNKPNIIVSKMDRNVKEVSNIEFKEIIEK